MPGDTEAKSAANAPKGVLSQSLFLMNVESCRSLTLKTAFDDVQSAYE